MAREQSLGKYVQEMELSSRIDEDEFNGLSEIFFHSVSVNRQYKSQSAMAKKEELIEDLVVFLNKYLALKVTASSKQKLQIINLIYKLTMQKKLIELQAGKLNMHDIKTAAKKLRKKSQSAFSSVK